MSQPKAVLVREVQHLASSFCGRTLLCTLQVDRWYIDSIQRSIHPILDTSFLVESVAGHKTVARSHFSRTDHLPSSRSAGATHANPSLANSDLH